MLFKAKERFRTAQTDQLIWWISIALLAVLGICQFLVAFDRSPTSDDAMVLSVPKNWVNGYGWATSYSEKIPFNPDFTAPPAMLVFAALLIKLFGNHLWVGGLTGAIFNLTLLALNLQQIRLYWKNSGLAALCLVFGCIISKPDDFSTLVGYYSGSLIVLLSALIAFNRHYSVYRRGILIGLLAAVGLHLKWLLAPAFAMVTAFFLLHLLIQKSISFFTAAKLALLIIFPIIVLHGSWNLYRQHVLSGYSEAYLTTHKEYGTEFFRYHGSGVGQWQDASDKALYLTRNFDKNLYFVEESLAEYGIKNPFIVDAPADEHHIVAWILIAGLLVSVVVTALKLRAKDTPDTNYVMLVFSLTILIYLGWFAIFSMAMSPSHFYFPNQWLLWVSMLAISQSKIFAGKLAKPTVAALLILVAVSALIKFEAKTIQKPDSMQQAADYIQKTAFAAPLAGCGYSGYPRHIEYLLPNSQNFADCLDLIVDHVELADGHYRWKSPLAFNLVFSLQSNGINSAASIVFGQCNDKMLYRNNEVAILSCEFSDLQKINLDALLPEIEKTHRWYRTRLRPAQ